MTADLLPRVTALLTDRRTEVRSDADLLRAFVNCRDEQAFATLVRRHGPLVLATARRATGNPADADDVFQATFLLLARNAAAVRNPAAVAGWLHGVANRMSRTARRTAARRRAHEARTPATRPPDYCDLTWREVQQAFEEELARLPDRYRVPFVLCVLNSEPRADVARRLRIREGTISSRLAEAKRRLQDRLTARGVSLAVVLGAVSLPSVAASAELVYRSVRTALGQPVSAAVSALVRTGVIGLRAVAVSAVLAITLGIALVAGGRPGEIAGSAPPSAPKGPPTPAKDPPIEKVNARGTLLNPDGKPVAGAPVSLWSFRIGDQRPEPKATTDTDGRFQFDVTPSDLSDDARVVVNPKGQPAQWLPLTRFKTEQTLRLPKDDVAFSGRIASLENQPLKGVTVQIVRVSNVADGEVGEWTAKNVAMRLKSYWLNEDGLVTLPGKLATATTTATTDADGKFKLTGFGRDRVLTVKVFGPNVETKFFWVVSRPGGPAAGYIRTRDYNHGMYGPDVSVLLGPSRPLVGTVRNSKTGKPVAGVVVSEVNNHVPRSVTDKDGRYRLEGVPKKAHYGLNVAGAKGVPYFDHTHTWVADVAGLDPIETDLTIDRGLELTGRVVDEAGRPVRASVYYSAAEGNPNAKSDLLRVISSDGYRTKPDGTFYLTAWPGKGVIDIRAEDGDKFATVDVEKVLSEMGIKSRPVGPVHGLVAIDADADKPGTLNFTVTLREGASRKGTVVGPDGKPLSGAKAAGLRSGAAPNVMGSADFALTGLRAGNTRLLVFVHEEKKLGVVQTVTGDSTDPVEIKLAPLGSAAGRVARAKDPVSNLTITAIPDITDPKKFENLPTDTRKFQGMYSMMRGPWRDWTMRTSRTDADGRFKIDGLLPGLTYTVYVSDGDLGEANTLVLSKRGVMVEAGKEFDLGELKR